METAEKEESVRYGCFGPKSGQASEGEGKHSRSSSRGVSRWWNSSASAADVDAEREEELGTERQQDLLLGEIQASLLGLDISTPPAPTEQHAPKHERKVSWTLSGIRRVMPQTGKATDSAPPSPALPPTGDHHADDLSSGGSSSLADASASAAPAADAAAADSAAAAAGSPPRHGNRGLWKIITSVGKGDKLPLQASTQPAEFTVEGLSRAVLALKPPQSVLEAARLVDGLHALDSRAVAALLKELSKSGAPHRAAELFDYLRSLPDDHELAPLADLYTYTTGISQCGGHQHIRRALELVAEMRGRGVQCNVHTYSALMSVCVKCNECDLALDVYQQLQAEGITPNMVTYNILIDAYARTGQWQRCVEVLDPIAAQGLAPEARTYNAIIAACGKAGQSGAALRMYERMLADGVEPTGTTYTSVISAFGRAGQVEEAVRVYRDMAARGCERNVITYSSLISVCERAGRADVALSLLGEMRAAGVRPNVVTYNGLIGACAQAGMWRKATELADEMAAGGCRPDAVTYAALVAAFERGGEWRQALAVSEKMQAAGFRPDACCYNSLLGALWSSGRVPAQRKAAQLLAAAQRQGALRLQAISPADSTATAYTVGAAVLLTLKWLCNFRDGLTAAAFAAGQGCKTLLLVRGKHGRADQSYDPLCGVMRGMFEAFSVPATAEVAPQGLLLKIDARALPTWAASPSGLALLSPLDSVAGQQALPSAALLKEDRAAEAQCGKAFAAVQEFEGSHVVPAEDLALHQSYSPTTASVRQDVIACITALAGGLQLREETPHDAVQLLDRLLATAPATQQPPPPACAAALLMLASRQSPGGAAAILRAGQVVLQAAGLPLSAVAEAEVRVSTALGGDTAAISPLRVLQLYLERMGCDLGAMQKCQLLHVMSLTAMDMVAKAALSPAFASFPPSVVAAACLLKARQSMGLAPAWPIVLQSMTGYEWPDPGSDSGAHADRSEQQEAGPTADRHAVLAQCAEMLVATGISA